MNLLQMSFTGGVLILAVIVLRALTLNRLPKGTFLTLWAVAALRLLTPFSIPSPASVYTLAGRSLPPVAATTVLVPPAAPSLPTAPFTPGAAPAVPAGTGLPENGMSTSAWSWVWLAGMLTCGTFFLVSYLRCRREFLTALPVEDQRLQAWLAEKRLRRAVAIRQSDRIRAPLTYGLLRPVILLPKSWAANPGDRPANTPDSLTVVLEHELVHIQHLDALWKPLLALTACVHWFNPLVWCMFALANRDIELRCDEIVVRRFGMGSRPAYALALISMEEKKSGLNPFASAFSKNAIEERIIAIMKIKKRSIAAVIAAVALVCCVGIGFATSAAAAVEPDLRDSLTVIPSGNYTEEESRQLFSLWFDGYGDMTVSDYREKMRSERGGGSFMELIERYSLDEAAYQLPAGKWADALAAFNDYFFNVYEPLTADSWQTRDFDGIGANGAEYCFRLTVLDPDALSVSAYETIRREAETILRKPIENFADAASVNALSTSALQVELGYYSTPFLDDPDALLHKQSSEETAAEWDRLLSPYVPFGLTYQFDDPDHDGNGLTMWFDGKEVRGICDGQEHIWITEHIGNGFSDGAVELYAVYTDSVLTGLRIATPEEQSQFDQTRNGVSATIPVGTATVNTPTNVPANTEQRKFPLATQADYDAFLTLYNQGTGDETLEVFNQRLLDWANEDGDGVWDRISSDAAYDDYGVELNPWEKQFVALTCVLSGRENAAMIRALYTGGPEEDPRFFHDLPMKYNEEDGIVNAWCSLYYDISYHITDKSAATVMERDACVGGMMNAISAFWQDTDLDALLTMTEADVASLLNAWAEEASTENIRFNPITEDGIQFEACDERRIH